MSPFPHSQAPLASTRTGKRRRWSRRVAWTLFALLVVAFALDRLFPLPLPDADDASVIVVARDGTPLRAFANREGIWRYPTTPEQVSPLYVQSLLTYEDRWFWRHPGVNPFALARSTYQWIRYRHVVSGGSTITMQVARIIDPPAPGAERSLGAKLRQILRALQLEAHLSKRQILTLYLDHAPFGGAIEGVEAASWAYLGKPSQRLSHAEAALLAVLPQTPSRLRPDRHAQYARIARDKLMRRMVDLHVWTPAEAADARIEPVITRRLQQPMLAALLSQRLREDVERARILSCRKIHSDRFASTASSDNAAADASACRDVAGPQRIVSTLDAGLQKTLETRVSSYFAGLPERTSAALLVVDNATLEARAYVGSVAFGDIPRLGHVDMVRAWRSPGSTLKPFLYGLAIDDGLIHSESLLVDAPQSFGDYRPGNFDSSFNGPVGAAEALRLSLNVPAVDLLDRVDPVRFAARMANAGVVLKMPHGAQPNLSMILGGDGVTLEDLVGAYTALHRDGIAGRVRLTPDAPRTDRMLLSPGAAWIVKTILDANPRPGTRADTFDPGSGPRVAWKTGTSYGFRDAWAVGGTRRYTVGVWVGRPDGTPLPGQYGVITALPLFFEVIDSLPRSAADAAPSPPPPGVRSVDICWPLGTAFDPAHPELCARRKQAWVLGDSVPPTFSERRARLWSAGLQPLHVDATTGERLGGSCTKPHVARDAAVARWPALASPWLSAAERRQAALPPLAKDCDADALGATADLQIDGVVDHASVARPPNSPVPVRLSLHALGASGRVTWMVNDRLQGETLGGRPFVHEYPETGVQTVTAMAETGAWTQVEFKVLR